MPALPRHTALLLAVASVLPVAAFAFDYDRSREYSDAPFTRAVAAAVSVLTDVGALEGNPDGSFAPNRPLNRAEFLKIVLASHSRVSVTASDADNCFPDVRKAHWFSRYVCIAKMRGVVGGYPDGFFHPERPVNYAEAVVMLVRLYEYELEEYTETGDIWFMPAMRAVQTRGTGLTADFTPARELTRGEMARLAAAFVAESQGKLTEYRDAEHGVLPSSSSSSSAAASSVSSAATSSVSSSATSVSSASSSTNSSSGVLPGFPARSQLLLLGDRSKAIASATFFANLEPMMVRAAEVKFDREIQSIESMYLMAADGTTLGQLALDHVYDSSDKTWRGSFATAGAYKIPKGEQRTLGIEVRLKERNKGGYSEELIEVDTFRVTVEGEWGGGTVNSAPNTFDFPKHQTVQGRIGSVKNAGEDTGVIPVGTQQQLASFRIIGSALPGTEVSIEHLEFQVSKSSDVTISNWRLGTADSPDTMSCSVNVAVVNCLSLASSYGSLGSPRTYRLFGDVSLDAGAQDPFLQVSLNQAGSISENGAIRWTDSSGHFNWVDLDSPLARGTKFD